MDVRISIEGRDVGLYGRDAETIFASRCVSAVAVAVVLVVAAEPELEAIGLVAAIRRSVEDRA
ncbi:MAG: hypothetical protein AB1736_01270 [Chloroflexota bacterium]